MTLFGFVLASSQIEILYTLASDQHSSSVRPTKLSSLKDQNETRQYLWRIHLLSPISTFLPRHLDLEQLSSLTLIV